MTATLDLGAPAAAGARVSDFLQLTKPRITLLVVLTTLVGFLEAGAGGAVRFPLLCHTLLGTALVAAAASSLNQWAERHADAAMERTRHRPLPAGRLTAGQAAAFGLLLLAVGVCYLAVAVNGLTALLAFLTAASYLLAYTPLKRVTSLATVVGAIPGALPPLGGWAAVTGRLDPGAWVIFLIVFLWQMPHFLAIAVLCREDYARAGFRVLPMGMAGGWYFAAALVLGLLFLAASLRLIGAPADPARARTLFRLSLVYLPAVLLLLTTA